MHVIMYLDVGGLLRTIVTIKRLDKDANESPKACCRELMIASSLQHPNVVPLLGFSFCYELLVNFTKFLLCCGSS